MECGSQCKPGACVRAERTPRWLTAAHSFDFEPVQNGAALKSFSDLSRGAESSAERHAGQADWAPRKPSSPAPQMPAYQKGSPVFPTFPQEENRSFPACFATGQSRDSGGGLISAPRGYHAGSRPLLHMAGRLPAGFLPKPSLVLWLSISLCLGAENILLPVSSGHFRNLRIHLTSKEEW